MATLELPDPSEWGHHSPPIRPAEIIEALKQETERAITEYTALSEGPEPYTNKVGMGYCRISVTIPLNTLLFDQLMNGATGYRAHYSVSMEMGETFNRCLVEAIGPILIRAERLYQDIFGRDLCQRSLLGHFSKFWFAKETTDLSTQGRLLKYKEEIRVARWRTYWRTRPKPRKGLLAPIPENAAILLNGTFVNEAGEEYEQKPGRSKELFESGWT
jgi:hypothetical protein